MSSRETYVNYTMPLGLHHLIGGDHYAPMPQNDRAQRKRLDRDLYSIAPIMAESVSIERAAAAKPSSNISRQSAMSLMIHRDVPSGFCFGFHRLAWDHKMSSAPDAVERAVRKVLPGTSGSCRAAENMESLADKIDSDRHKAVADRLAIQVADSEKWRIRSFNTFSASAICQSKLRISDQRISVLFLFDNSEWRHLM